VITSTITKKIMAMVEPRPIAWRLNRVSTMCSIVVRVESRGPPGDRGISTT
jgi:hypothetical protein